MLYPHLNGKRIILASQSPRRLELVRGLELEPVIWLKKVDESFPEEIKGPAIAEYVTRIKAQAYLAELETNDVLITGDTVVLLGDKVLQKPQNREEAIQMLSELSDKTHTVASGVAVTTAETGIRSVVDTCDVTFRKFETDWIEYYIDQYEPYDKAGAYGVQDFIGFSGVERMNGSYFTVMGLPTHQLFSLINSLKS